MRLNPANLMSIELEIQNATSVATVPDDSKFRAWAECALKNSPGAVVSLRLVDREESQQLNSQFRHQDKPTNVLSFPAELPPEIGLLLLGDIAICAPLVEKEASEQGKSLESHWAHLSVHGILHLLGYDHQDETGANEMESLEIEILEELGFSNPYH